MHDVAVEAIRSMNPVGRSGLVFPSPNGEVWHDRIFRQDYWKPALAVAGVR
jgi:hypothetical protein